jgi:hypothetical protein
MPCHRIKAIDKVGIVSYSNVAYIQLTIDNYQLVVYPNPARGLATIKGSHIASVKVMDDIGREVSSITLDDATNP